MNCIPYENKKTKRENETAIYVVTSVSSIGNANNSLHYCEMNVERKRKIVRTTWKNTHAHTNMHLTKRQKKNMKERKQ